MGRGGPISEAVEQLYTVFARYRVPRRLDASPLRDADAILRALTSAPLNELGYEQVLPYAGWALTTVGGPDDYRHFLPRIFELSLADPSYLGAEPAVIVSKLNRAGWAGWPAEERSAIRAAFSAAWEWALGQDPTEHDAERWLTGLAVLGEVTAALDLWRRLPSPHRVGHLARLVWSHGEQLSKGRGVRGGFWDDASPGMREDVTAWVRSAEAWRWLRDAPEATDQDVQWWLLTARTVLYPRPDPD